MVQRMSYFRVKHLRLPAAYARFLEECLEPGGTLFVVECGLRWPTTRVGDRHVFQFGALGGATPEEYVHGSPRVAAYLDRYGSSRRGWDPPAPDAERPEARVGLRADPSRRPGSAGPSPGLAPAANRVRPARGLESARGRSAPLVVPAARPPGAPAARRVLYPPGALLGASRRRGPLLDDVRRGGSAAAAERYLDGADPPYAEIGLMLFSHGVDSVGVAPIERWQALLRARHAVASSGRIPAPTRATSRRSPATTRPCGARLTVRSHCPRP